MSDVLYTEAIARFLREHRAAIETGALVEPTAMTVATADAHGRPTARTVLLKGCDERGFVFYTNLESRKGKQIADNPRAALSFFWPLEATLDGHQQVHVEGRVEQIDDHEADAYYASRHRGKRIGAWASLQSQPLDSRATLQRRVEDFEETYPDDDIPRPPHWSGLRVIPDRIEFWYGRQSRLHDREVYERQMDGSWKHGRLFP